MISHKRLNILFGFMILLLLLPLLQQQLNVIDSGSLAGVTSADTAQHPGLSLETWLDGTFQEGKNNAVRDSIGFRPDFIRLSNQVNYSLFRKSNAHVVIGKNDNLFEQGYIDAYLGKDFVGEQSVKERVHKLKYLQDTLDRLGKKLVFIYAPSKLRYWIEELPESAKSLQPGSSNYITYRRYADREGLRQIDFNSWFISLKGKVKHPVLARSSIHWTVYGALLAADSFRNFMVNEGYRLPDIRWDDDQQGVTAGPIYSENDLQKLLNLMWAPSEELFFHPYIALDKNQVPDRPSAIYIADSFMWMWFELYIPHNINSTFQFWHYDVEVYKPGEERIRKMSEIDPMAEMMKADWIVIMYADCNFSLPGGQFVEKAYHYFKGSK